MRAKKAGGWIASGGGALALLAPKGLCPICMAASGGLLSSIGLGFLAADGVIRWVLPAVLALGVAALLVGVRQHRRWWVLAIGLGGATLLYFGWLATSQPPLYAGMALLLAASVANFWSQRHPRQRLVHIGLQGERHGH